MDTQQQSTTKIPAIRTYAKDLEINRKIKGLPVEVADTVVEPKTKTPVVTKAKHKEPLIRVPTPTLKTRHETAEKIVAEPLPPFGSTKHQKQAPTKIATSGIKEATFVVDNEDAASATIITDTKKNRFKLAPEIILSIKNWFVAKKLAYQTKKTPKYTVPETTRRKGVIQKATSKTGKLETSDFTSIQERILKRKEEEEKPESTTTWSANTEPGYLLLEEPETTGVVNVQVVGRKSYRTSTQEIVLSKNNLKEMSKPVAAEVAPAPIARPVPQPVVKQTIPAPVILAAPIEYEEPSEPEIKIETTKKEILPSEPEIERSLPSHLKLLLINTNTLALGVSGLVLAVILFSAYLFFIVTDEGEITLAVETSAAESIIDAPQHLISGATNDKIDLIIAIDDTRESANGEVVQVGLLFSDKVGTLIPPQTLIPLLFEVSLEQSFLQSISQIRFGFASDRQPYILMKVTNEIAAKGGLLNWEKTMYKDLSELFAVDITQTSFKTKFLDASIQGVDVRILKSETGTELLVYGIISGKVIITTNSINFSELAALIN